MAKHTLTPAEIGEIVRSTRKATGLRQDELAGAAGVGLRFIVDLEAGKPRHRSAKRFRFCRRWAVQLRSPRPGRL